MKYPDKECTPEPLGLDFLNYKDLLVDEEQDWLDATTLDDEFGSPPRSQQANTVGAMAPAAPATTLDYEFGSPPRSQQANTVGATAPAATDTPPDECLADSDFIMA